MKITELSEIDFISRFELLDGVYRYNNEVYNHKNELFIIDNSETILPNVSSVYKIIERILKSLPNDEIYQIDIDSTIAANDDIHAQNNNGSYGIEVLCFDVHNMHGQKLMFGETPQNLLNLIAYIVDEFGYNVSRQNDYVNILGYINKLLLLKQHFNKTSQLRIYSVSPKTNDYLNVLNIESDSNSKSPVYLSLFAKCGDGGGYDTTTFSEAVGLNIFNDKTILQTLTKFNN